MQFVNLSHVIEAKKDTVCFVFLIHTCCWVTDPLRPISNNDTSLKTWLTSWFSAYNSLWVTPLLPWEIIRHIFVLLRILRSLISESAWITAKSNELQQISQNQTQALFLTWESGLECFSHVKGFDLAGTKSKGIHPMFMDFRTKGSMSAEWQLEQKKAFPLQC